MPERFNSTSAPIIICCQCGCRFTSNHACLAFTTDNNGWVKVKPYKVGGDDG